MRHARFPKFVKSSQSDRRMRRPATTGKPPQVMRWSPLLLAASAALTSLCHAQTATVATAPSSASSSSARRCFPDDFLFGSATAAYQVEGAWNETGRTPSIWDDFCRKRPHLQCANVADDFLHRYKDDIQLMADTGLSSFRFSISWSRVMNWNATAQRMVRNQPGIDFYHALIDAVRERGIVPIITLYHWDLPHELHLELSPQGWLNSGIASHFTDYAALMFQEYGGKVDFWSTFNEPWTFTVSGYNTAAHAPGLNKSRTNAYTVAHNVLISHGRAVELFRTLKSTNVIHPRARIGIVLNADKGYPLNASDPRDLAAVERKMQFGLGWFLQPLVSGEYPAIMRERSGDSLPRFTAEEAAVVKGSYDLFMLNHYSSKTVTDCNAEHSKVNCSKQAIGWERDMGIDETRLPPGARPSSKNREGKYNCNWFSGYPQGYLDTIRWMHQHDPTADILLTENGWCGNEEIENEDQLWYFQTYLEQVYKAITEENIPVIGYSAWSFVDNYEWGSFKPRFGLYYVNFTAQTGSLDGYIPKPSDLARIPRLAARWYAKVAKSMCLDVGDSDAVVVHTGSSADISTSTPGHVTVFFIVASLVAVVVVIAVVRKRRNKSRRAVEGTPLLSRRQF